MEKTCFRKTNPQITAQGEEPGRPGDRSTRGGSQDVIIGNIYRGGRGGEGGGGGEGEGEEEEEEEEEDEEEEEVPPF
jgi:hypothetical protein